MAAMKKMVPRNHGTIIQVGSALGVRSIPLQSAYCGAKHAINGFTESIRTELLHKKSKVHITVVQMPALNTPQFGWNRARMPNKPRPVAPIFQPEVGAEAILYAARQKKKQLYVGFSSLKAIYGQRLAPSLLDHYVARTVFEAQMTEEPLDDDRQDNLFHPVPGLQSAHGAFDREAHDSSLELTMSRQKKKIGLAALALGVGITAGYYLVKKTR